MTINEALKHLELVSPFNKPALKKAYREALMVWHPDRFTGNEELRVRAEGRTKQINEAFALLKEIPETDYPYQPLPNEPRKSMGAAPPAPPRSGKAPRVPEKSNTRLWFIVFAVLAMVGAAALFKFQSGSPEPKIVSEVPVAEVGQVAQEADNVSASAKATAPSKEGPDAAPVLQKSQPAIPLTQNQTPASMPVVAAPPKPAATPPVTLPAAPPIQNQTPASMPVVAQPPNPATAPPVTPQHSETDLRLDTLDQAFKIATDRDAWKGYRDSMSTLDKNYSAALERALAAATSAGKLEDAIALRAEKQRLEKGGILPTDQEEGLLSNAPVLKELRKTYRATAVQHEAVRNNILNTLYDKYDQALAGFQTDLTKAGKLDDALRVKTVRDYLTETKATGIASPTVVLSPPIEKAVIIANGKAFTNSLGMKFVPLPGTKVLICVHETRRQDYEQYAKENTNILPNWQTQQRAGVPCGYQPDHPVVGVTWDDAQAFCAWLTKKEKIHFRLPTDIEWSFAAGIGKKESAKKNQTPEMLHQKELTEYPWGGNFPPTGYGNFADETYHVTFPTGGYIKGFDDHFATTSPVMSFKPNKLGLFDLGGNVWEWVEDWFNETKTERVLRGASLDNHDSDGLLSSFRLACPPANADHKRGFRVVIQVN
jgi:formylglycine-generating enzyme required for sulfatase activity